MRRLNRIALFRHKSDVTRAACASRSASKALPAERLLDDYLAGALSVALYAACFNEKDFESRSVVQAAGMSFENLVKGILLLSAQKEELREEPLMRLLAVVSCFQGRDGHLLRLQAPVFVPLLRQFKVCLDDSIVLHAISELETLISATTPDSAAFLAHLARIQSRIAGHAPRVTVLETNQRLDMLCTRPTPSDHWPVQLEEKQWVVGGDQLSRTERIRAQQWCSSTLVQKGRILANGKDDVEAELGNVDRFALWLSVA